MNTEISEDISVAMFEKAERESLKECNRMAIITSTEDFGNYERLLLKEVDEKAITIISKKRLKCGRRASLYEGKTRDGQTVYFCKINGTNRKTQVVLTKEEALKDYNELNEITLEE